MAYAGKHSEVKFGANTVAKINDASFTINGEVIDVSAFDGEGWSEFIQGLRDADIDISGFYDATDTNGQVVARAAILTQNIVSDVTVLSNANLATSGFTCDAFVETFEISTTVDGAVELSISMQSSGPIAVSS